LAIKSSQSKVAVPFSFSSLFWKTKIKRFACSEYFAFLSGQVYHGFITCSLAEKWEDDAFKKKSKKARVYIKCSCKLLKK